MVLSFIYSHLFGNIPSTFGIGPFQEVSLMTLHLPAFSPQKPVAGAHARKLVMAHDSNNRKSMLNPALRYGIVKVQFVLHLYGNQKCKIKLLWEIFYSLELVRKANRYRYI